MITLAHWDHHSETAPSPEQTDKHSSNPVLEDIKDLGTPKLSEPLPKNPRGNLHCLTIIGQVEGHMILPPHNKTTKYEHVIPQLISIEDNPDVDGLLVVLNTVGGDVEAGLAISEMIASMSKPTVSLVLGGGHSIGVPLAVSTDYSFIAPSASMTIHPVRMSGTVIGVSQTFEYFEKMQERIVNFVERNSKISAEHFKEIMLRKEQLSNDVGSVIIGKEAVEIGLIDELGGLREAIEKLYYYVEVEKKSLEEIKNQPKH